MLLNLVWRDWMLNRRALVPAIGVFAAFQFVAAQVTSEVPGLDVFAACLWACILIVVSFVREEQFRATAWACTLPATRADLVRARYVGSWLLIGSVVAVAVAVAVLVPGNRAFLSPAFDVDPWLLPAAIVTPVVAVLFPFVIRFGMRGAAVLLVPPNLLLPVVFVVSKVTGTQDDVEGTVLAGIAAVAARVTELRDGFPAPVFYGAVIALLVFVNWLSYRLAVTFFRRREL